MLPSRPLPLLCLWVSAPLWLQSVGTWPHSHLLGHVLPLFDLEWLQTASLVPHSFLLCHSLSMMMGVRSWKVCLLSSSDSRSCVGHGQPLGHLSFLVYNWGAGRGLSKMGAELLWSASLSTCQGFLPQLAIPHPKGGWESKVDRGRGHDWVYLLNGFMDSRSLRGKP